jgi:hypothetical protein
MGIACLLGSFTVRLAQPPCITAASNSEFQHTQNAVEHILQLGDHMGRRRQFFGGDVVDRHIQLKAMQQVARKNIAAVTFQVMRVTEAHEIQH